MLVLVHYIRRRSRPKVPNQKPGPRFFIVMKFVALCPYSKHPINVILLTQRENTLSYAFLSFFLENLNASERFCLD